MIWFDRCEWNRYVASQRHAQFLQSWEWGEFQKSLGFSAHRIGVRNERGEIVECALFIEVPLFGTHSYFYCPRGPVGYFSSVLFDELKNHNQGRCSEKKHEPLFVRCEPSEIKKKNDVCAERGRRGISIQPNREWLLDLSVEDADIFSGMHPKTRYNIRLARKKNVQVREVNRSDESREQHVSTLYGFLKKTAEQKEYRLHDQAYYSSLIEFFSQRAEVEYNHESPFARLFESVYEDSVVASACMVYFGDTAYYLFGGSDVRYGSVMAPFALHAHTVLDAKEKGYRYYNFGGISPEGTNRHPLSGVTRFKTGFGGEHILYPGTFDIVLRYPEYMVYQIGRPFWRIFNRIRG